VEGICQTYGNPHEMDFCLHLMFRNPPSSLWADRHPKKEGRKQWMQLTRQTKITFHPTTRNRVMIKKLLPR
jgi:hypothetical protein